MENYKIHNKSSKPNNIVKEKNQLIDKCIELEDHLPRFFIDYFIYLKNAVAITTRLAYLRDIDFFCEYLVNETNLTNAMDKKDILLKDIKNIKARDVNRFLGSYCTRYFDEKNGKRYVMENHNRALSRKRSSLSSLFKFLFRDERLEDDITSGFNPIKLPKPQPDAIKRLEINEVDRMMDAVENGVGLTKKEKQYWRKTKLRDRAILLLFTTYGLRLKELRQLNLNSFNFERGTFKIYRKRGKEVNMPINKSVEKSIKDYISNERPSNKELHEDVASALFISLQGKRMTGKAIRNLVKKYTAIALGTTKKNGYSPHKLRATAASNLLEFGFSIYDVQNLLDHDNVTTTQLYSAHRKNAKRNIVSNYELDQSFDKNTND